MSILGALFSGVSGLGAESQAMGMIADNISNANTTAYKETDASFSTLVTQIPTATSYQPGGVVAHPVTEIAQQGLLQSTSSGTDLAISGGGFFVVNAQANDSGAFTFTRAGSFTVDANGNLKNGAGLFLQGQKLTPAQAQAIASGNNAQLTATALTSLTTVNVTGLSGSARPTANITLAANLPAANTSASTPETMTVPVFDSQGTEHDLTLNFSRVPAVPSTQNFTVGGGAPAVGDTFTVVIDGQTFTTQPLSTASTAGIANAISTALSGTTFTAADVGGQIQISDTAGNVINSSITPIAPATETFTAGGPVNGVTNANQWTVSASINGGTVQIAPGDNKLSFNPNGTLNAASTFNAPGALSITQWNTGGASVPQNLTFNLGTPGQSNGLTQFGGPFAVTTVDQDGLHFGNFTGITINQAGIVTANFDNGLSTAIYLIPIATFPNPDGLAPQSGNTYLQTDISGNFLLQQSGTGQAGQIAPSSLESSTVDIATQFANLIVTQRAYEANSKVITTSDQMLQDLIQAVPQ
ncbi:MAG TPA: flagellar hook-basal body complex protein [Stellaceae bacterium]|nr:flagellar hook-basal body complex protein [Stellaceae bacterium]